MRLLFSFRFVNCAKWICVTEYFCRWYLRNGKSCVHLDKRLIYMCNQGKRKNVSLLDLVASCADLGWNTFKGLIPGGDTGVSHIGWHRLTKTATLDVVNLFCLCMLKWRQHYLYIVDSWCQYHVCILISLGFPRSGTAIHEYLCGYGLSIRNYCCW